VVGWLASGGEIIECRLANVQGSEAAILTLGATTGRAWSSTTVYRFSTMQFDPLATRPSFSTIV
jgi:hypothetical protein